MTHSPQHPPMATQRRKPSPCMRHHPRQVLTSPFSRAKETAEAIRECLDCELREERWVLTSVHSAWFRHLVSDRRCPLSAEAINSISSCLDTCPPYIQLLRCGAQAVVPSFGGWRLSKARAELPSHRPLLFFVVSPAAKLQNRVRTWCAAGGDRSKEPPPRRGETTKDRSAA